MHSAANRPRWFSLQGKSIGLLIVLVLAVLIAGATGSVCETLNLLRANQWVAHTLEVLNQVEHTHMELRDAEAAQRGYVITGDAMYLEGFRSAQANIDELLPVLRLATADNPRQQRNLRQFEALLVRRLERAAQVIAIRQQSGFEAARQEIATKKGVEMMVATMASLGTIKHEELGLLEKRSRSSNWAAVRMLFAVSASTMTALLLLVLVYRLIRRDRIQRAEAAERFRLVVESCPTGIVMVDRVGRIALVNGEIERAFGYKREELLGQPIELLVPQRFRREHPQDVQRYLAQAESRMMGSGRDLYGLRKDGSEFPVEIGLHPTPTNEGLLVLAAVVDITERKQREEEVRRFMRRLEQSNRELQDFAYVSSHDLQEPLRKIQAFGDRLQAQCNGALGDEGRDYVLRMQKAAARMRNLIEDLLQFSRITTKAQPFAVVDLNRVVAEVLEDLEVRLETTGGGLSVGQLPTIDADPSQMRQLFQNLIGNALKFSRPDVPTAIDIRAAGLGAIDGRRSGAALRNHRDRQRHRLRHQIRPPHLRRVPTAARARSIRRLGHWSVDLSQNCRAARRNHYCRRPARRRRHVRRDVAATSNQIRRPVSRAAGNRFANNRGGDTMPQRGRSIQLLMAEDDPDDRLLATEALQESRLANDLNTVEDGEELMDYLYRRNRYADPATSPRPDLILLDLNMPRKDGREAAREIKSDPKLRRIPIVVLTTSRAEEDICRSYDLGVSSYITKPVKFEGLVEVMRTLGCYWFDIVELPGTKPATGRQRQGAGTAARA